MNKQLQTSKEKYNKEKLVSIIIPVYNRAHLIAETLRSIIDQTYIHWECIIVDDQSTDNTMEVISAFAKIDTRLQLFQRPDNLPKGAPSCRNLGLDKAIGDYVQFFDSDDIMVSHFLAEKIQAFEKKNVDFVLSKTIDFIHPETTNLQIINTYNYYFDTFPITHYNYASQRINWLTPDAMIRTGLAKQVKFNEKLKRGQEYNYFVKLTLKTSNGLFVDKYLTHRRLHEDSIKSSFNADQVLKQSIELRVFTLQEIYKETSQEVKLWFAANLAKNATRISRLSYAQEWYILQKVYRYYGIKNTTYYILARLSKFMFNRNEIFRKPIKKLLH